MQITKTHKIIISAVIVLILLSIYIAYDRSHKANTGDTTYKTATTTDSSVVVGTSPNGGGYKIEVIPPSSTEGLPKPIPDLNRPVTSSTSVTVSTDAIVKATEMILKLQATLKKSPGDVASWVDLGIYQKMAGDYQGTVISWTYATKVLPSNFVAFADLGDLYAYFLKDQVKSEMYYKLAISKAPLQTYLYTQLAGVYKDIFKDVTKARAIIDQGLAQVPNDPNLLQMKASLN